MRSLRILCSPVLFVGGLLFVYFIVLIISEEVLPALANGSLTVETDVMILNRVWKGNEIYGLLAIYAIVAAGLLTSGICIGRKSYHESR